MPGVYISYPFCRQKCTYCNFASGPFERALEERYLDALRAELQAHEWRWRPETVYVGGGTPGNIEPGAIERVLAAIPGSPWQEATIEASPGSLNTQKVEQWRAHGINRVSLGVQSFVQREITGTGRRHTAETVSGDVTLLRRGGIGNFNIDLIAGLPGQTVESWRESLAWVERLEASHVSVYMLEVDEDSRLGREILRGGSRYGAAEAPGEELTVALYETAAAFLQTLGVERYEISNFARPGWESRHNLKYWRREAYAGFGSDAHSFDGEVRSWNVETPAEYVARFERGEPALAGSLRPDAEEERFFVGLRLAEGIRPRTEEWQRFGEPIRRFVTGGLLETDGERLRLTSQGVLLSNEVFKEFVHV